VGNIALCHRCGPGLKTLRARGVTVNSQLATVKKPDYIVLRCSHVRYTIYRWLDHPPIVDGMDDPCAWNKHQFTQRYTTQNFRGALRSTFVKKCPSGIAPNGLEADGACGSFPKRVDCTQSHRIRLEIFLMLGTTPAKRDSRAQGQRESNPHDKNGPILPNPQRIRNALGGHRRQP